MQSNLSKTDFTSSNVLNINLNGYQPAFLLTCNNGSDGFNKMTIQDMDQYLQINFLQFQNSKLNSKTGVRKCLESDFELLKTEFEFWKINSLVICPRDNLYL